MCYRAFEKRPLAAISEEAGTTHVPQLRPRWVGAGLAVVAATTFAAVLVRPTGQDASTQQRAGSPQQLATPVAQSVATIERVSTTTLPADDDVPTSTTARSMAAGGDCHHGL